ncbi:MAG: class I SAM-dependent methyltransferase [Elusimicrobia bacterium]|nr:class I SAM-dependent methyltransferase [Elusimicrobiota bacterium]
MEAERAGARQPHRFDPAKAARLDDPARFEWLPPEELFALLDAPRASLVVDLGTGTGAYALRLARARPDLTVAALDEQATMLDLLRSKLASEPLPNLRPVLADAAGLKSLAGRASRILAVNVLHELGDAALRSAASLLEAGGRVLFADWNAAVVRPVGPPRDHVYSPEEGESRLSGFGWTVLGRRAFRFHYALLCEPPRA